MDTQERPTMITEADTFYVEGRLDEALALYRQALAENNQLAWAHSRIGAILAQQNQLEEAESALLSAIELDPALPQAHSNLGNIYYARGQYTEALAKYKEAVALDPDNPTFHQNLHAVYKRLGKVSEAIAALKQSHKLGRNQAQAKAQEQRAEMRRTGKGRGCLPFVLVTLALFTLLLLTAIV